VVVNDLVIKKKFRPDFKELILDSEKSNLEKIEELNTDYSNIFEEIDDILSEIDLFLVEMFGKNI
jgi:hypothetical protein